MKHYPLPETGYLRLAQIVGNIKAGIPPIIPISKSTWWAGVKSGRFPQAIKLSERCTAWRVEDVRALIEKTSRGENGRNNLVETCRVESVESIPPAMSEMTPTKTKSVRGSKNKTGKRVDSDPRQGSLV